MGGGGKVYHQAERCTTALNHTEKGSGWRPRSRRGRDVFLQTLRVEGMKRRHGGITKDSQLQRRMDGRSGLESRVMKKKGGKR